LFDDIIYGVLGLKEENSADTGKLEGLMKMIFQIRDEAKIKKDFATSDNIRQKLKELGFEIKDGKDGTTFSIIN